MPMGFAGFSGQKYLNLETFKKSGEGVKTPVWFAAEPSAKLDSTDAKLYVYTIGVSGKVKRIRNNSSIKIAPCNMRGDVQGEWVFCPGGYCFRGRSGARNAALEREILSVEAVA
jgi:PPOX class probable F420-dependent enzyme